jgi:hypothetical protein
MSKEIKEMVEPSIVVFGFMLQEAILDGWRISEQYPVNFFGGLYVVNVERGEDEAVVEETPIESAPTEAKKQGRPARAK